MSLNDWWMAGLVDPSMPRPALWGFEPESLDSEAMNTTLFNAANHSALNVFIVIYFETSVRQFTAIIAFVKYCISFWQTKFSCYCGLYVSLLKKI